jgi:hypothetical protein
MLKGHGHTVIFHREVCGSGVDDDVVCDAALKNEAILIAVDGDMKSKPKRYGAPTSPRFAKLNIIRICCKEPLAEARLEQALDLIMVEWAYAKAKAARRLWVEIMPHQIRTNR